MKLAKEHHPSEYAIGMGFDKLVECLFNNPESYFYKQLSHDGISLYASIYDLLFSDFYILTTFNPLGQWNSFGAPEEIISDKRYIDTYLKALNKAIDLGKFREGYLNSRIGYSLHKIPDYLRSIGWLKGEELGTRDSNLHDIFISLHSFFGRDFPLAYKKYFENGLMSDFEKEVKKGDKYRQCLTAEFCEASVDLLGEFTRIDRKGLDSIYAHMLDEYILPIHQNEVLFGNLRNCYLEYAWDQIKDNVVFGHYPTFIRLHIIEMKWNNPSMPEWRKRERAKLIKYLNEELNPRLIKKDTMANFKDLKEEALLPDNLIFDSKKKKFYWVDRDGSQEEFK